MKITKQKIYLTFAGVILSLVGAYISLAPSDYLNQFGLANQSSLELFSELRGMGGNLLVFGLFVLLGAFYQKIESTAIVISALVFSSFSVFRVIGIVVDGIPGEGILFALIIEMTFAFLAIIILRQTRASHAPQLPNSQSQVV